MQLVGIRIRSYRTVLNEQFVDLKKGLTLVGPNNSGKTNILTAIRMLFTGYENIYSYQREHDLTFGQKSTQTSLVGIFTGDKNGKDKQLYQLLGELKALLNFEGIDDQSEEIQLYLTFSPSSNPSYRFFPNTKRPSDGTNKATYSRKERDLVSRLLGSFVCHYVPSNKSFEQLYEELLIPFIKEHVANALNDKISEIENSLSSTADSLTLAIKESGLSDIHVKFNIPNKKLTDLLSSFEFKLLDPDETSLFKKGVGIQSTVILSSFDWITQRELNNDLEVIWLIEEPEAFLHPTLNQVCKLLLHRLQSKGLLVVTTHSLSFVPQDPELTAGVTLESSKTIIKRFKTYRESTEAIRKSIGVRFSDFFNFGKYNILLEGPSDRDYFVWILNTIPASSGYAWKKLRSNDSHFLDYGGVKFLAGFLRATWEFIREETIAVSVFDGDQAGEKERKDLQNFFGQKNIPFLANEDYVSVRKGFPIEALFPDLRIKNSHNDHPGWFENFSIDASSTLESFDLKDLSKNNFAKYMKDKAQNETGLEWAVNWINVCNAIENALEKSEKRITEFKLFSMPTKFTAE